MTNRRNILGASQVQHVLRYKELIPEIEKSFVNFSDRKNGGIIQPVRLKVPVKEHSGILYVMPCYSAKDNALITKVTAPYYSKDNVNHRVPSHLLYFNAGTGDLVAIMDGTVISEMRTASGLGCRHKARCIRNDTEVAVHSGIWGPG
ncbi:hypothetical protein OS493_039715 [Desmophyllum pertusum]|uniref:Ketimine reductase mu-crystallin n=1 Tax=Desmophyllum pertusum TaxID=174260 RepID=A0A9W9Z612_9CNID|nr:hypothetical protein OS493_039715 [Desmophyllum pertusum]